MSGLIRLGVVRLLLDVQFWFPVWLILLLERGFSLGEAAAVDGIFRITVVLAELPMGRIADRFGRRRTLAAICVATAIVFASIGFVDSFPGLVATWIAWGLLWALASGIDTAYSWELAKQELSDRGAQRYLGATRAITGVAGVISLLTAGWLYTVAPGLPFWVTSGLAVVALLLTWTLPDIDPSRVTPQATSTSSLRTVLSDSCSRNGVYLAALVLVAGWTLQILVQPLALQLDLSPTITGLVYAAFAVAGGVGGVVGAHAVAVSRPWVPLSVAGIGLACAAIAWSVRADVGWLAFAVLLPLIGVLHAVAKTITDIWVAQRAGPRVLASVLSVVSLSGGVVIALARPGLAVLSGAIGAADAFAVWGVVCALILLPTWLIWRQRIRLTSTQPI